MFIGAAMCKMHVRAWARMMPFWDIFSTGFHSLYSTISPSHVLTNCLIYCVGVTVYASLKWKNVPEAHITFSVMERNI